MTDPGYGVPPSDEDYYLLSPAEYHALAAEERARIVAFLHKHADEFAPHDSDLLHMAARRIEDGQHAHIEGDAAQEGTP